MWNYQDKEACTISHQSHFNVNLLSGMVQKHPLSSWLFMGCVILVSITVTGRRRAAGQRLSLSAHSCPLMCSVWGTDNFHWLIEFRGWFPAPCALAMITDYSLQISPQIDSGLELDYFLLCEIHTVIMPNNNTTWIVKRVITNEKQQNMWPSKGGIFLVWGTRSTLLDRK